MSGAAGWHVCACATVYTRQWPAAATRGIFWKNAIKVGKKPVTWETLNEVLLGLTFVPLLVRLKLLHVYVRHCLYIHYSMVLLKVVFWSCLLSCFFAVFLSCLLSCFFAVFLSCLLHNFLSCSFPPPPPSPPPPSSSSSSSPISSSFSQLGKLYYLQVHNLTRYIRAWRTILKHLYTEPDMCVYVTHRYW